MGSVLEKAGALHLLPLTTLQKNAIPLALVHHIAPGVKAAIRHVLIPKSQIWMEFVKVSFFLY